MKKVVLVALAGLVLAGCQNRAIWNDAGEMEEATTNRKVWDTQGQLNKGERVIWRDAQGNPVIQ
ncbi:MAG: membrane lipoprotein lipid attachment site-containing protein [Marinobacter sp.]|uniref:membrane lipoprotein lipid attachment site-containing protein n=1 Tax=Marinobacter sp. TaxID=50741 RepID=UPI00299F2C30|nr:membrane lipoprotein lipid attachment site-containing protein [Marinobacter sp.]MDX1636113.1 membrane lipoprotein lipid attachment site-containing protein [Marinobacter sp.]